MVNYFKPSWEDETATQTRHAIIVGAAVHHNGHVLLVKSKDTGSARQWVLPSTCPNAGEQPDASIVREVYQSTNITATATGLLSLSMVESSRQDVQLYVIFLCRHVFGEIAIDPNMILDARYVGLPDLNSEWAREIEPFARDVTRRVLRGNHQLLFPTRSPAANVISMFV